MNLRFYAWLCVLVTLLPLGAIAAPADGIYDVALVTDLPSNAFWQGTDLNQAMTTAPGTGVWRITKISGAALATDLAKYDVVVISATSRSWVTTAVKNALAAWVQGGGLLVLAPESDVSLSETVLGGLGSTYAMNWVKETWYGEKPQLVTPSDPLFTTPNALNNSSCSSNGFACHDGMLIDNAKLGTAWTKMASAGGAHKGKLIVVSARAGSGAVLSFSLNFTTPSAGQFLFGENVIRDSDLYRPADTVPPTVTLDPLPSPTSAAAITVSGRVQDAGGIASVEVWMNGAKVGGVTPAADGTVALALQLPLEGANQILLRATDPSGNVGSASASVTLDTTAPVATISAPVTLTNQPSLQVSGNVTDSDGLSYVAFVLNQTVMATPTPGPGGDVSTTLTLFEGSNTLGLLAIDAAGNRSVAQTTVTLDTAAPTAHFHDSVPAITNSTTITVTATVLDPSGIQSVAILVNGAVVASPLPVDGVVTAAVTLAEGENTLALRAFDNAGNLAADERAVVLDTVPPQLVIASPAEGAAFGSSDVPITVQVADQNGVSVQVGAQSASYGAGTSTFSTALQLPTEGWNQVVITAQDAAGNISTQSLDLLLDFSAPVLDVDVADGAQFGALPNDQLLFTLHVDDLSATTSVLPTGAFDLPRGGGVIQGALPLVEGLNAMPVTVTDEVGHVATLSRNVIYDLTPPTGRIASPGAASFVRGTVDLSVEAADNLTGVAGIEVAVDGNGVTGASTAPGSWYAALDTSALSDGPHAITARLVDGVGNFRELASSFVVDNTAPVASLASPAEGSYLAGTVQLNAGAADATSGVAWVAIKVNGAEVGRCAANACAVSFDTTQLPDGPFNITVDAMDLAGNAAATVQRTAIADNTAPSKFLIAPISGAQLTRSLTVAVQVTDDYFQRVECFVGGQSLGASTDQNFSTTVSLLGQLDGPLTVRCSAVDLAGNVGTESATVQVHNWTEELNPRTLNLKSASGPNSVTLYVEGVNVSLLESTRSLALSVPGGAPVGALSISSVGDADGDGIPDVTLKFDRQALISSIRAGIQAGTINASQPLTVRFLAAPQGSSSGQLGTTQVVGGDTIVLKQ